MGHTGFPKKKKNTLKVLKLTSWMNFRMIQAVIKCFERENRPVHALSGIMGNQGKIAKRQSAKMCVYPHISILRFIFERKLIL